MIAIRQDVDESIWNKVAMARAMKKSSREVGEWQRPERIHGDVNGETVV